MDYQQILRTMTESNERAYAHMRPLSALINQVENLVQKLPCDDWRHPLIVEVIRDVQVLVLKPGQAIFAAFYAGTIVPSFDREAVAAAITTASQNLVEAVTAHFDDPVVRLFTVAAQTRIDHLDNDGVTKIYAAAADALRQQQESLRLP